MEPNHGFSFKLEVLPPQPARRVGGQRPSPYTVGCVWTKENWSCSYDAAFMVFWSLFEQSPPSWRDDWVRHAPDWNAPLRNNFNHLILLADTPLSTQDCTKWFSRYRDRFHDQLSRVDPVAFPRTGPHSASVTHILEVMFCRTTGPYLTQRLLCRNCGALSQGERQICLLSLSCGRNDKVPVWLHTVWTEFIDRFKSSPERSRASCSRCQGPNEVQALKISEVPWIWFEQDECSPVWPLLALAFESPTQNLTYSLRAIIYSGGNHFSVRFREQSGRWWRYDGRVASGVPQPDNFRSEAGLLTNGPHFACVLIYRRDGY